MSKKITILLILTFFCIFLSNASTIILTNGETIKGRVVKRTKDKVVINVKGVDREFDSSEIERIKGRQVISTKKDDTAESKVKEVKIESKTKDTVVTKEIPTNIPEGEIPLQYRKKDAILYRGKGCSECSNTGYKGRLAVIEALSFDNTIRDMIIKNKSTEEIRDYALKSTSMLSLREDASDKCFRGETTLEEVLRVTTNI